MRLTRCCRNPAILIARCFFAVLPFTPSAAGQAATVANYGFRISTAKGSATVPLVISFDWSKPQPQASRAVVIFHGRGRDVEDYYRTALEAAAHAGAAARDTVFIAPQFLNGKDLGHDLALSNVLRWTGTQWESGEPAAAPIPLSSFEIVDALLARLADRSLFSNLRTVVLAGHSGGAQLLQRYAVIGRAPALLTQSGNVHLRFVIANPSSYLYFSDERPGARDRHRCKAFNRWKYGTADAPAYVTADGDNAWSQLEAAYAQRDVIYLLGTTDTDPHADDLDVSCAGEAQGPTRFARGQAYYAWLHSRHASSWNQRLWFVPGVAHSATRMFTSTCGVSALFDTGSCPDQ